MQMGLETLEIGLSQLLPTSMDISRGWDNRIAEFAMKFEVKEGGLAVSGEGSIKTMGTYSLSGSNYTLTPTNVEGTGSIDSRRGTETGPTDEDTGTWSRRREYSHNKLANDGETVIVLKKK